MEISEKQHFIKTVSGKDVNLLEPDLSTICIEDIAHSLSMQCRFNGMTKSFYSVAEHSMLVASRVRETHSRYDAFCGLMHDAHEAYIGDMVHPLKMIPGLGDEFKKLDELWMGAIAKKFGTTYPHRPIVVKCDMDVLTTELRDLTHFDKSVWGAIGNPGKKEITQTINPDLGGDAFLKMFKLLQGRR